MGSTPKDIDFFILDEPTTELHFHDITKSMVLLNDSINQGNSVIMIEHDPIMLSYVD